MFEADDALTFQIDYGFLAHSTSFIAQVLQHLNSFSDEQVSL